METMEQRRIKRVVVRADNQRGLQRLVDHKQSLKSQAKFAQILKDNYLLSKEDMATLGYPLRPKSLHEWTLSSLNVHAQEFVERKFSGLNVHAQEFVERKFSGLNVHAQEFVGRRFSGLNVHAHEFVPRSSSGDSENGSNGSSEEESCNEAPGIINLKDLQTRSCARCSRPFSTTSTQYVTLEQCQYHPGKMLNRSKNYSCCGQSPDSLGCAIGKLHVWSGPKVPEVDSLFVETEPPKTKRRDNNYGVYSLDCEMSYTVSGLEVVKVTVININGNPVYNEFVKPENEIVDYNTKYSGIVAEDFVINRYKSLAQVQGDLKRLICSETVLIGHGLENDLKGLKLLHKTVVDTAFVFRDFRGLPYRMSLKNVAQMCLNKEIQNSPNGHDSFEDAQTCMQIMLFKCQIDFPNN